MHQLTNSLTSCLGGRNYWAHLPDENAEAQRGKVTFLGPHSFPRAVEPATVMYTLTEAGGQQGHPGKTPCDTQLPGQITAALLGQRTVTEPWSI